MSTHVQVLSTATPDSSPCVMVATEHERHLFNAGEGTQRLCMEHRVRIVKTDNVFLTHIDADTVGGLPGASRFRSLAQCLAESTSLLLLSFALDATHRLRPIVHRTLSTGGVSSATALFKAIEASKLPCIRTASSLHGPPGLSAYLNAARSFMRPNGCALCCEEASPATADETAELFVTPELRVHKVLVRTELPAAREAMAAAAASRSHGGGGDCGSGGSISRGGGGSGGLCCMCYVCETPESPGKFNASRAAELGIPRGPLYGQLKCGRPVTLDDGRVIQPSEVVADSVPPAAAAIVACPSPALIGPLAAHPHWRRYMPLPRPAAGNAAAGTAAAGASTPKSGSPGVNGGNGGGQLRFMIHLAADEIISAPEYQAWCRRFGPGVAHVVASARRCGAHTPFLAALSTARKLNSLCPDVFPVPRQFPAGTPRPAGAGSRTPLGSRAATAAGGTRAALPPLDYGGAGVVPAAPLLKCHLYPPGRIRIDASEALATERISAGYEAPALTGAAAAAAAAAGLPAALEQLATARSAANSPAKGSIFGSCGDAGRATNIAAAPLSSTNGAGTGVELAFLGTGSAIPSKYRNVSGIYLCLGADGAGMLMDCGEGTMGQLWRMFGDDSGGGGGGTSGGSVGGSGGGSGSGSRSGGGSGGDGRKSSGTARVAGTGGDGSGGSANGSGGGGSGGAAAILRGLKVVWISHHHADHHLGLIRVLKERERALAG
ncbi:unnamed protein product, partial [Phaeothamnion confervicola]